MPFEFPTAPALNDDYTIGGIVYTWTGTNWDIKGGNDPQDFILRAGDTMTGPLGFGLDTHTIHGDTHMKFNLPAAAGYYFYNDGIEQARINEDGIAAQGHVRAQGGGHFAFSNTDNNAWQNVLSMNGGFWLQYHQGGNNDGRLRLFTSNGGYSDAYVLETTIVSGTPGIIVNGNASAGTLTSRSGHIQIPTDGHGIQFNSGAYCYKKVGTGMTLRKHTGNTQWGIENNDGTGRVNIATTTLLATVEEQIEERVTPLLARIDKLEAEIAALKTAQPRNPSPPPVLPRRR